jgi:formylglycine-generating enzyme required for sulfatase activity
LETPFRSEKVFISYRRDDTPAASRLLFLRLTEEQRFGADRVFFDIHAMRTGTDFVERIHEQVAECTVMLAVIGRSWAQGKKIFEDDDFVRLEILAAVARAIPIMPIFVDGAKPPKAREVPAELRPFLRIHGLPLSTGGDFDNHIDAIEREARRLSVDFLQRPPPSIVPRQRTSTTGSAGLVRTQRPSVAASLLAQKGPLVAAVAVGALLSAGAAAWRTRKLSTAGAPAASASAVPTASSSIAPPPSPPSVAPPPPPASCPDDMVLIPAGEFFMGSDEKYAPGHQQPRHNVNLPGFCMDLYEVTAKRYLDCASDGKCRRGEDEVDWPNITPSEKKIYSVLCTRSDPEKADHPVNCVTWEMAHTYCNNNDKRLPTEAEWEYTTRGPDGRLYPWGDEAPTERHLNACGTECLAWAKQSGVLRQFPGTLYQADDGFATTAPVGKFPAGRSRFGPYDVVGNVWEWVQDWEGVYSPEDQTDPQGPSGGTKRVIRGGAWNGSFLEWIHPAFRYAQDPQSSSHGVGFRCAKSL